ncbi:MULTISPECIES: Rrf2 family transcriptional regulator [Lysinibacillus]|uniref:Rrf2 family transcriptional regulator n=1 Tax=Lysinibacillus irui TaxID=2998077 RepID=A0AAJ5RNZ3_9BACI|nr:MULTISPECIES: Rrf2 family transcriptional regulator [Lysinibacillus]WDV08783.1 Rrf2 family transcriptional regulator [Lysinibacillus irui]
MKYSVMVEYALHSLVYLIDVPPNESIGIKDLSEFQGLSETYLSKVLGKLSKEGIVSSVSGVKGGYRLNKKPQDISFWDVVRAVEGEDPIFQCKNIKANFAYQKTNEQCESCIGQSNCTINSVMLEAEEQMRNYLRSKTIAWLEEELQRTLPGKQLEEAKNFFKKGNK